MKEGETSTAVTESPLPKESKTHRYVRITFACIVFFFFAYVIIMTAWRKFGG